MPDTRIPLLVLRPLPAALRGVECSGCRTLQARWAYGSDSTFFCSRCVLYATPFGNEIRLQFEGFAQAFQERAEQYLPQEDGKFLQHPHLDNALARFVLAGRMNIANERMNLAMAVAQLLKSAS